MSDEDTLSENTWARAAESVRKLGYMDGASDGQTNTFQSSFDIGYNLGFKYGLKFGVNEAYFCILSKEKTNMLQLGDPGKLNCTICLDNSAVQDNIANIYNKQKETYEEYLQNQNTMDKGVSIRV